MNRWNIPDWLEQEDRERDRRCVYCGIEFTGPPAPRHHWPSWEHIVNDLSIVTRENIVLCCIACNSSKGARDLETWFRSRYCRSRGINGNTVATIIKAALKGARASESDGPISPP